MWSALGKYKSIVISIALFLLLDASVLILNFYISFKIADDAVGVNLAGRQRMLSQRTVKTLLDMQASVGDPEQHKQAMEELQLTYTLFNQTLNAFDKGGSAKGADGSPVELKAVTSPVGRKAIEDAKALWLPYSQLVNAVLTNTDSAQQTTVLNEAIEIARASNLSLLALMNKLTVDLENVATSQATTLRYVQTVGISLAIINFLIILFHFIGELKRNDRALEEARQETTDILNTVNEGLFLLDSELTIGHQHSAKLTQMFGNKVIADQKFSDLIGDLVKPKDLETAQRFISLLFRPDIKSNLISDLNPLNEIEVNLPDDQGGYNTLYLSFEFTRVTVGDTIQNVLVTVNDVTEKVKLANQLAEEKEKGEQQLEMLTSILHTNPATLKRFVNNGFDTFGRINSLLKDQSKNQESLKRKLNDMFIEVHNFKGEASALGLETFSDHAHNFESDISELRNKEKVTGNDFLKLTVQLEKLMKYTESVQALAKKLASFATIDKPGDTNTAHSTNQWQHLNQLVQSCSDRQLKKAELILTGFNETPLDEEVATLVDDLCIQFIRNAISHSVESPSEREHSKKPSNARIDARLARLPSGDIELSVRDDGKGIDYEKIREKAKSMSKWNPEEVATWSNKKLLNCIFETGFSTSEKASEDSGRGVGMDVIAKKIKQHNGKLRISSRFGQDCLFTVTIPAKVKQTAVA